VWAGADVSDPAGVRHLADRLIGDLGGLDILVNNAGTAASHKFQDHPDDLWHQMIAVEPAACPSLTRGVYAYDYGDTAGMAPIVKMHTLGHTFVPQSIHAGGLRYHGAAPLISHLYAAGLLEAVAYPQNPVFAAAMQFARSEGLVPAPESSHAIRAAIDEALRCKESGEAKTILFNLSGHGFFDLTAYDRYLAGELEDYEYPVDEVQAALAGLPSVAE
jgi:tryptophan synthase beta chain